MKNLVLIVLAGLLAFSCSSSKVNEVKITVAEKMQVAVVKELKEAYIGLNNCDAEAEMIGQKVYDRVAAFLKIEENKISSAAMSSKSLISDTVPVLCAFVAGKILAPMIESGSSDYTCLRSVGAMKFDKITQDLCLSIDL